MTDVVLIAIITAFFVAAALLAGALTRVIADSGDDAGPGPDAGPGYEEAPGAGPGPGRPA